MWRKAGSLLLSFWVAACSSIGPATVSRDRVDYVNAIGTSWERETLLNIIKLRYGHAPVFLSVTQVVTGYQFQSTVTGGLTASNFSRCPGRLWRYRPRDGAGPVYGSPDRNLHSSDRRGLSQQADDANPAKRGAICPSGGLSR